MSDVAVVPTEGGVAVFEPRRTYARLSGLEAAIKLARRMRDWPALEAAVEAKIAEQSQFVVWWNGAVSGRESPGRGGLKSARDRGQIPQRDAEGGTGISNQQVSRWRGELGAEFDGRRTRFCEERTERYRQRMMLAARRACHDETSENHRAEGTGENEWFTPAQYIEAARQVMGGIDLDPATHLRAQEVVRATQYFTRLDDGLARDWHGRVWLNPPYAQPYIQQFTEKMVAELNSKRVSASIMLTHNYTDTAWFHLAASAAAMICFTRGRIRFVDIDGELCAPTQGQAFFYYGADTAMFDDVFSQFGLVLAHA